jgi:hypothetical protein
MRVVTIEATAGMARLSVYETSASGEDFLMEPGDWVLAGTDILVVGADDIFVPEGAWMRAGKSITLVADNPDADDKGSTITVSGAFTSPDNNVYGYNQFDTLVATNDASFVLSNSKLTRTLRAGGVVNIFDLFNLEHAILTGGTGNNTFDIGGWTGTSVITGMDGTDTIIAATNANFIAANDILKRTGCGDALLSTIEYGVFRGGSSDNSFDVTKWTLPGEVHGDLGIDVITANNDVNFALGNAYLKRTGIADLILSGLENAKLTGGNRDNTFTVTDWTGGGLIDGEDGDDSIVASNDTDFLLSDIALTRGAGRVSLGSLALARVEDAQLSGGKSANRFTISDWTGTGRLAGLVTDTGGTPAVDTLVATTDCDFVLSTSKLERSGGRGDIALSYISSASLAGGARNNTFDVSGWSGLLTLAGGITGNDTVVWAGKGNVTLSDTAFNTTAIKGTLASIKFAEIKGDSSSATYDITGWTGLADIQAGTGTDTLLARSLAKDAVITDTSFAVGGKMLATLRDFEMATMAGTSASQKYDVTGWNGSGTITAGGGTDLLLDSGSGAFAMSGKVYTSPDGSVWTLDTVGVGLTGSTRKDDFNLRNWTAGAVTLNGMGGSDNLLVEANANITVTPTSVTIGSLRNTLASAFDSVSLIGGASANTFTLTGWTKDASVDGGAGKDTIVYVADTDFLLRSDRIVIGKGVNPINTNPVGSATFMLRGMETVTLTGGNSANNFTVAGFAGTVNLDGKNGSDIYNLYLNNADATLLVVKDTGTVRTDKDSLFAYGLTSIPTHSTTLKRISFSMSRVDYANIELVQVLRGSV